MDSTPQDIRIIKNLIKSSPALSDFMKHIILYSKGHYKKTVWKEGSEKTFYNDLAQIIAHVAAIPVEAVRYDLVEEHVIETFMTVGNQNSVKKILIQSLSDGDPVRNIQRILGEISTVQVRENDNIIWDIGNPDPAILPLAKVK